MAEKIIVCKSGKLASKGDNSWIELVDQEDKTHRVFPSMQTNDGEWVHLEKKVDMLKGKIEAGEIEGLALKLTKEKKGTFWNVIAVEEVKDVFQKEALAKVKDGSQASIEQQVAIKEIGENWRAGILKPNSVEALAYTAWILDKLNGYLKGVKDEPDKDIKEQDKSEVGPDSGETARGEYKEIGTAGELAKELFALDKKNTPSVICVQLSQIWSKTINKLSDIETVGKTYQEAYQILKGV